MSDSSCELRDSDLDAGIRASFETDEPARSSSTQLIGSLESLLAGGQVIRLRQADIHESIAAAEISSETTQTDRYQLLAEIGQGGMGTVYWGRDTRLGCDLAIKVLRLEYLRMPGALERFVEEAQIAGQLQHPGIVPVHELGQFDDGRLYITMKLVRGQTLAELLARRCDTAEDRPRFLAVFLQVCQTLAYAHSRGVIHRDLKPANIMVGPFGEVQVMDWGLAKVVDHKDAVASSLQREEHATSHDSAASNYSTHHGTIMGTPAYSSPEQARGDVQQVTERSDVFGLGAILCEILTGTPPYFGENVRSDSKNCELSYAFARLDRCGADGELINLAKRSLAKIPCDRPTNAGELADELNTYLVSVEQRLKRVDLENVEIRALAKHERKMRWMTVALATTILIWAVFGGAAWLRIQRQRQQVHVAALVNSYFDEGSSCARRGKWKEARDAYWQVLQLDRQHLGAMFELSPLLVQLGDLDRYEKHCQYLLTHANLEGDPSLADRAAKSCLLTPRQVVDPSQLERLVEHVLSAEEVHWATKYFQLLNALHAYRNGDFHEALSAGERSRSLAVGGNRGFEDSYVIATDHAIEAMAQFRLGHFAQAERSISQAEQVMRDKFPKLQGGDLGENWNDWLISQILFREAKVLVETETDS